MNYKNLFYFDIETVSRYKNISELEKNDKRGYELFLKKIKRKSIRFQEWNDDKDTIYKNKSSLIPEYGKIVCVSMAYYKNDELKIKSVYNDDEQEIVIEVNNIFNNISKNTTFGLCGYYIKGFDIPWLNKKMMKYELKIPSILKTFNIKPWNMNVYDLSEIWKSNGTLEHSSFDEMLFELNVDSPKENMSGEDCSSVYWGDNDLEKIKIYCENDVIACVNAAEKLNCSI